MYNATFNTKNFRHRHPLAAPGFSTAVTARVLNEENTLPRPQPMAPTKTRPVIDFKPRDRYQSLKDEDLTIQEVTPLTYQQMAPPTDYTVYATAEPGYSLPMPRPQTPTPNAAPGFFQNLWDGLSKGVTTAATTVGTARLAQATSRNVPPGYSNLYQNQATIGGLGLNNSTLVWGGLALVAGLYLFSNRR